MRRRFLLAFAVAGMLLVPGAIDDRRTPTWLGSESGIETVLDLAPAAGPEAGTRLGPADLLRRVVARVPDERALAGLGAACGLIALIAAVRRRRERVPVAADLPATIAEVVAPAAMATSEPAARPPRVEVNALSNALATIDMLDLEMRTSLKHAGQSVADLAAFVAKAPLVAVEPGLMMDEVRDAAGAERAALAATTAEVRALREALDAARAHESALIAASRQAIGAAEAMDRAFQATALLAGAGIDGSDPGPRADRFRAAFAALTEGIVGLEERLVALDDAAAAPGGADVAPTDRDTLGAADRAAIRIDQALGALGHALKPADGFAADARRRADATIRTLDQALARVATILSGFETREERRRFHRIHADLPARILVNDVWTPCHVANLSLGGAAIDVALDAAPGTQGQIALTGCDSMLPLIVTGASPGRTHLCFQLTEALERSLRAFLDRVPAAA